MLAQSGSHEALKLIADEVQIVLRIGWFDRQKARRSEALGFLEPPRAASSEFDESLHLILLMSEIGRIIR